MIRLGNEQGLGPLSVFPSARLREHNGNRHQEGVQDEQAHQVHQTPCTRSCRGADIPLGVRG